MKTQIKSIAEFSKSYSSVLLGILAESRKVVLSGRDDLQHLCQIFLEHGDFKGDLGEVVSLYPPDKSPAPRVILVGLGPQQTMTMESVRRAAGSASKWLRSSKAKDCAVLVESFSVGKFGIAEVCAALCQGLLIGLYQFDSYQTNKKFALKSVIGKAVLVVPDGEKLSSVKGAVKRAAIVAECVNFARDLQNRPPNDMTPSRLANTAEKMAKSAGLVCKVLQKADIEDLKMGSFLGVAKGSKEPPRFIVIEHGNEYGGKPTVLVGKGISFDSGGLSLKTHAGMIEMKFDMSGAAAVIGTMKAVAELGLKRYVVGLVPTCENMPSGTSMRPGDILTASSGKTIEVLNTDAEGRLILADALVYASKYKPSAVIDLATLTGACVVALGHHATGIMGNNDELIAKMKRASDAAGERVWELPLWPEYTEEIKGDYADIKNTGGRWGGAITAAAFLKEFVDYPWVHLDIAGTADTENEKYYYAKGGTGVGVRLLIEFLNQS
jgi:leucyl aminopeptidase